MGNRWAWLRVQASKLILMDSYCSNLQGRRVAAGTISNNYRRCRNNTRIISLDLCQGNQRSSRLVYTLLCPQPMAFLDLSQRRMVALAGLLSSCRKCILLTRPRS